MTVYELTSFAATDVYAKDPVALFKELGPALDIIPGLLTFQHNTVLGDLSRGFITVGYESLADHEALMASDKFEPIMDIVAGKAIKDRVFHTHHAEYDTVESETILTSKASQYITFKLKEGKDTSVLKPSLDAFVKEVKALKGVTGAVWGPSFEYGDLAIVAIGWESPDAIPSDLIETKAGDALKFATAEPFTIQFNRTNGPGVVRS